MNYSKSANTNGSNQKKRRKNKKRKNTVGTILLRIIVILAIVGCFAVGGAFLGAYVGILESAPPINAEDAVPENYTSILYDADGNEFDRLHGNENREYVKLAEIPIHLQNAVVAIEDERFYQHNGVDVKGMLRALVVNIKNMDTTQGASTLTQQLMKNEVLTSEKKLKRKLQEQYLAVNFEKQLEETLGSKDKAKDYILELYLNTIALNHGLNGVQSAAKFYFGKEVSELTLAESASIAGITKNPSAYSPLTKPENNKERQTTVLDKMLELGYISQNEYNDALAEDIYANIVGKVVDEETGTAIHNYFVDSVIEALADQLEKEKEMSRKQAYNLIYSGGLQIHTTMDPEIQRIMEESFAKDSLFPPSGTTKTVSYTISVMDNETEEQSHYTREKIIDSEDEIDGFIQEVQEEILNSTNTLVADNVSVAKSLQAAMTVIDYHNGQVKGIVGGREKNGDLVFNRATQALRQPGSCFKVLAAYAPAINLGIVMPGTMINDEPFTYNGWTPKNWYGSGYRGMQTVRAGVRDSLNILAAKTIVQVGAETAYAYLEHFGFTTLEPGRYEPNGQYVTDYVPALALGGITDGVTVLQLTAAYGAIANEGVYIAPSFYTMVYDHNGNVLIDNTNPETREVIKATTAYLLTDMMKDVITGGGSATGRLANFSGMTIAGKTGTTNDDKDLSFAGYTPYYVGGIWMGYDIPKVMKYDRSYHLLIWKDVMEQIHANLPNKDFERPAGIITLNMCSLSGSSPNGLCDRDFFGSTISSDLAAADFHSENSVCDIHQVVEICKESLKRPGPLCTDECIISVVLAIDGDGNVINNPTNEDGSLGEGAVHLDEICDHSHDLGNVEDGESGLTGLPGMPGFPNTGNEGNTGNTGNTGNNNNAGNENSGNTNTGSDGNNTTSPPPASGNEGNSTDGTNGGNNNTGGGLPGLTGLPGIDGD